MSKEYDVFISFKHNDANNNKTKDSAIAKELYEFLKRQGLRVFFSPSELEFLGGEYAKAIDDALDVSRFLIAVGCSRENLESRWVRYEWGSFLNEIRSDRKPNADVFVFISDMEVAELPWALRYQQAFDANESESLKKLYNSIKNVDGGQTIEPKLGTSIELSHQNDMKIVADILQGKKRNLQFGDYKWRVLEVQWDKALLIAEKVVERHPYNVDWTDVTWETCTLREYLNGEFLSRFTREQQDRIVETRIDNPDNLWYGTPGGNVTCDKIFLLGLKEVDRHFGNSRDYQNKMRKKDENGKFVVNCNGYYFSNVHDSDRITTFGYESWWWWLRSPGLDGHHAARCGRRGAVAVDGNSIHAEHGGVRPALWLKLEPKKTKRYKN